MKEEESVLSLRYLSPVVKQDLAELDKDGERRRIAMQSLKAFVDQLDCVSMPRFLNQVRLCSLIIIVIIIIIIIIFFFFFSSSRSCVFRCLSPVRYWCIL
jgi:hypothetical protein